MAQNKIEIEVGAMTNELLEKMEKLGLIVRITPSRKEHRVNVTRGCGKGEFIYKGDSCYGAHGLVAVAIDNESFSSFGSHPDNEDVLLLGGVEEKELLFLFSTLKKEEFIKKAEANELESHHFICFKAVFNDAALSFFTVLKDALHGECAVGEGLPATFYCTESGALPLEKIELYSQINLILLK